MLTAIEGKTACLSALIAAKADLDFKNDVRCGVVVWFGCRGVILII